MQTVAMASPRVPPCGNPRFHPKYIPEMTYPTPNPQSITGPRERERRGADAVESFMVLTYQNKLIKKDPTAVPNGGILASIRKGELVHRIMKTDLALNNDLVRLNDCL